MASEEGAGTPSKSIPCLVPQVQGSRIPDPESCSTSTGVRAPSWWWTTRTPFARWPRRPVPLGFEILEARDGLEALQVFEANREQIHLILMDLTMPRMDGEEAYRELRRAGARCPSS